MGRQHAVQIIWGVISIVGCGWGKDRDQKGEPEQSGSCLSPLPPTTPWEETNRRRKLFPLQAPQSHSGQATAESSKTLMAPSGSIQQEGKCYKSHPMLMCSLKTNGSNHTWQSQPISPARACSKGRFTHLRNSCKEKCGEKRGKRKRSAAERMSTISE